MHACWYNKQTTFDGMNYLSYAQISERIIVVEHVYSTVAYDDKYGL